MTKRVSDRLRYFLDPRQAWTEFRPGSHFWMSMFPNVSGCVVARAVAELSDLLDSPWLAYLQGQDTALLPWEVG